MNELLAPPENPLAAVMGIPGPLGSKDSALLRRYQVNVLVDHGQSHGAPVALEGERTGLFVLGGREFLKKLPPLDVLLRETDMSLLLLGTEPDARIE